MAQSPTSPDDILKAAMAAFAESRYADAAAGFRHLLADHPDVGELHLNLGASLRALGDAKGAEVACRRATEMLPDNGMAWFNLANACRDLGQFDTARDAYIRADTLIPGTPEVQNNLGLLLAEAGQTQEALGWFDKALAARPDFTDALTNRGNAYQRAGDYTAARADLQAALAIQPGNPVFRLNMSAHLAAAGDHAEALTWAERALEADPSYVEAELKRASLLIQKGAFGQGLEAYEARWRKPGWHSLPDKLKIPQWHGEDLAGKHLLVWNEQGFGDALMYAQFLPDLANKADKLTFLCEKPLLSIMSRSLSGCEVRDLSAPPPAADLHVSLMSVPHRLGLTVETIPAAVPYLRSDPDKVDAWKVRLGDGPNVGVIWAGNPKQAHDYARSIPPNTFAPLLNTPGVNFISLQVGPRGDEIDHPALLDVRADLKDFDDTAALMSALDLIVSVDSAPAHLAGALGCPTLILLAFDPDSRYLLGCEDCPWYPSARLIRQRTPGDWSDVITRTRTLIEETA